LSLFLLEKQDRISFQALLKLMSVRQPAFCKRRFRKVNLYLK